MTTDRSAGPIYTSACGACGPAVAAVANCANEYGPEWAYDTFGECGMCNFNCTNFGLLGTACTIGTKARCKRIAYLGDQTKCCLGQDPGSQRTCDPKLTAGSPQCDDALAQYCSVSDRIMSDPKCIEWKNLSPGAARMTLQTYCVNNIGDNRCKQWCTNQSSARDSVCDDAVRVWCETHPGDQYCACVKSNLQTKLGINPKCNDAKCLAGGYLTANMQTTPCPDITDCSILVPMQNSGVQLAGVSVNQNCGSKKSTTQPGSTATASSGSTTTTTPPPPSTPSFTLSPMLILFLIVIIIAILVAVVNAAGLFSSAT